MDMLTGKQIAEADLTDWRKLGQGLHARYLVGDFSASVRFVAAVGEAGDALGHHPRVTMGGGYVDLKLISDDEGTEHVVEWVTQQDVDLARRVTEIAAEQAVDADPASITAIELALDTAHAATSVTPQDGCRSCGSRTPTSTRPRASGSTSTSGCRTR